MAENKKSYCTRMSIFVDKSFGLQTKMMLPKEESLEQKVEHIKFKFKFKFKLSRVTELSCEVVLYELYHLGLLFWGLLVQKKLGSLK